MIKATAICDKCGDNVSTWHAVSATATFMYPNGIMCEMSRFETNSRVPAKYFCKKCFKEIFEKKVKDNE